MKSQLSLEVFYLHFPRFNGLKRMILLLAGCGALLALNARGVRAQACTGYVLYKEDFGGTASSPGIGGPLPDGATSYSYTTKTPVQDGQYSIRKQVTGHPGTWHQLAHDHTGKGYFMLINASYQAGLFYQTEVDNLCQGSSFYFSAWIANLMRSGSGGPLDPNIRFEIRRPSDDSLIGEYTTGTLSRFSTPTWVQYGIHFKLPPGESSVVLQMYNNQTGGNGNDLVLDDITFSLCGPAIQLNTIGTYQNTRDVCTGDPVSFKAAVASGFYKDPQYRWQFGKDTLHWENIAGATTTALQIASAQSADSGWYRILVAEKGNIASPHCRIASRATALNVERPLSFIIAGPDTVCEGSPLRLSAPEALGYQWEGPGGFTSGDSLIEFDHASVSLGGIYKLTRISRGGCVTNSQKIIKVQSNDLQVNIEDDSILCAGSPLYLNAANPGAAYQWNTGLQMSRIEVDSAGFYRVVVSKGVCRASDSVSIREILKPVVNLGNDTTICIGEPYALDASFPDAEKYLWQDGSAGPSHKISAAGTYSVTISNRCGTAHGDVHINTEECADHLIFPTAFSPNGDGQNDFFRPRVFLRVGSFKLKIFDRWGRLVFQSSDPDNGWDGTYRGNRLLPGAYVWIVRYIRARDDKTLYQKGVVTLLR